MKKYLISTFLLLSPLSVRAAITDPLVLQEKTVVLHISTTIAANVNPTSTVSITDLISLSTTAALFPHTDTGEIDISAINLYIDKPASSTGSVKIGVVNYISPSSGSVTFVYNNSFIKSSTPTFNSYPFYNYAPGYYQCRVRSNANVATTLKDGSTPYILSTDFVSGSTLYTSSTSYSSTINPVLASSGTILARVGDIVMQTTNFDATNSWTIVADIFYHSERP